MEKINVKEVMERDIPVAIRDDDILVNEENKDDNSYENCIARMNALKNIKKAVRDNYKNVANSLTFNEKIKYETAYSTIKKLEEDEAFKMIDAR